MKTLSAIQTIAKVGKIVSLIIFILGTIGAVGCAVGALTLGVLPGSFKLGGVTIKGFVQLSDDLSAGAVCSALIISAINCAGTAAAAKLAEIYFRHELEAGTPFTFEGAKEMQKLGIRTLCIFVGASVLSGVVYVIMHIFYSDASAENISNSVSFGLGLVFIVLSLIFKYGAEVIGQSEKEASEET